LADLFDVVVVIRPATHSIQVLRNERVIGLRQRKPIKRLVAVVTGSRSHTQADKMIHSVVAALRNLGQVSHDDIRSRHQRGCSRPKRAMQWQHPDRFSFAVG